MNNKIQLKKLSDKELVVQVDALVRKERAITMELLEHFNEMEQREIHLELGYPTLFSYLTGKLRYSESAASRRIATARCMRKHSEVHELLKAGKLNLTTVSLFAKILTKENYQEVLQNVTGKSRSDVERYLAVFRPKTKVKESIRPVVVRVEKPAATPLFTAPISKTSLQVVALRGQNSGIALSKNSIPPLQEETEERFEFRFSASQAFMDKFEKIKQILSNKYPTGVSQEKLFMEAMEIFLEKRSPERREARREKRKEKKVTKQAQTVQKKPAPPKAPGCAIPQTLRDKILVRDGNQCTFIGKDGKRCIYGRPT